MPRDEVEDKNWKRKFEEKGYFIFRGLLSEDDIAVIKEKAAF